MQAALNRIKLMSISTKVVVAKHIGRIYLQSSLYILTMKFYINSNMFQNDFDSYTMFVVIKKRIKNYSTLHRYGNMLLHHC